MILDLSAGQVSRQPSPWPRRILRLGLIWAAFLLILMPVSDPTPENRAAALSIALSGLYTLLLYRTRHRGLPRLAGRPQRRHL